jgi:hypothetical protein
MTRRLVLILLFAASAAAQRAPEAYTKYLLPVLPFPDWNVEMWIRNDGNTPVDVFPLVMDRIQHPTNCVPSSNCFRIALGAPVPPRTTLADTFAGLTTLRYTSAVQRSHAGATLYVEKAGEEQLRIQMRLRNVEIPVVPESAFRPTPVSLRLQTDFGNRYTLRVYSFDDRETDVTVRFYTEVGNGGESLHSEHRLRLTRQHATAGCGIEPCPWPALDYAPAYAAYFFDEQSVPPWLYRVEINTDDDVRVWAMLSETNYATGAIRIVP